MNRTYPAPDVSELLARLTPKQQKAAELYVAGPPSCLGSKVNSYVSSYDWKGGRAGARSKASALFGRPEVNTYVQALRARALEDTADTLRDWSELAVDAQETLHRAATGSLPPGLSDEALRSAVRAASYIVDRAYGTPSQQIELRQTGGIVVHVAGPETVGHLVELTDTEHRQLEPAPGRQLNAGTGRDEELRDTARADRAELGEELTAGKGGPGGAPLLYPQLP